MSEALPTTASHTLQTTRPTAQQRLRAEGPLDPSGPGGPMSPETTGGDTIIEERTVPVPTEAGDHERFSHYVRKDKIVESAVMGTPVVALCGKVWTPSRDPQKFPVCPECQQILDGVFGPGDDSGDGGSGSGE